MPPGKSNWTEKALSHPHVPGHQDARHVLQRPESAGPYYGKTEMCIFVGKAVARHDLVRHLVLPGLA